MSTGVVRKIASEMGDIKCLNNKRTVFAYYNHTDLLVLSGVETSVSSIALSTGIISCDCTSLVEMESKQVLCASQRMASSETLKRSGRKRGAGMGMRGNNSDSFHRGWGYKEYRVPVSPNGKKMISSHRNTIRLFGGPEVHTASLSPLSARSFCQYYSSDHAVEEHQYAHSMRSEADLDTATCLILL
ncbi:hypothetical protein ARMSODRAFT_974636 [Armillaria solidipes]|uniref:Uncharacterized protein n=1 Tax=Armillaria solidipes TaxID=1076256 RepID=A0A2H3BH46_9AGAR|nr:hypothetical protein ARMSODRAFT_974636 [Armillaria solidipes]